MATKRRSLRVVEPDETPAPPVKREIMTVAAALEDGDELDLELAQRAVVAKALDNPKTPARDLAVLTKRMSEMNQKIKMLEAAAVAERSKVDAGEAVDDSFDASAI